MYSTLAFFQHFFAIVGIKKQWRVCFRRPKVSLIFDHHSVMILLAVHLTIGHRKLRDVDYCRDDERVNGCLG